MMKRQMGAMLVAAVGLAIPAAAGDLATSMRGKWLVDKAATMESMGVAEYKNAPPDKQKAMRDGMPDMVVEFTADTATMTPGGGAPQVASYKVTKSDKTTVWIDVTPQGKDAAATEKLTVEFVNPNTVNMKKEGDPMSLRLNRAKAAVK